MQNSLKYSSGMYRTNWYSSYDNNCQNRFGDGNFLQANRVTGV